jgi:pilus assembly protein CpaE
MILLIDPVSDLVGRLEEARPDLDVHHVGDVHAAERALEERDVEAVLLGHAFPTDDALELARKLHEANPDVSIVLATKQEGPELYREAMRAGVADVLPGKAELDEVGEVLDRAIAETLRRRATAEGTDKPPVGTTIATFSTKGGCGKSFLATNLATLLAERYPGEVVLVDLDLQAGDAALMLQLIPERSLREAAELGTGLDDEALRGFLTRTRNLEVLAAPNHPIHAEEVTPDTVVRVLELLRHMFRWVIIDGPPSFTEQMLAALDQIDVVAVVSSLDVPSIKNLRLSIETLQELGVPRDRMKLVLNRADSKVGLTVREVEKSLGTTIDMQLPSSREVPFAVNQGLAIVSARPKSAVSKALREALPMFDTGPRSADEGRAWGVRRRGVS